MKLFEESYHSFLLRLWRVRENGIQWRATLEDVQTGDQHGFPNLTALIEFLKASLATELRDETAAEHLSDREDQQAVPK